MTAQDCPNCHYPSPSRKPAQEEKEIPQSPYHHVPEPEPVEDCPQCFYQPEAEDEKMSDDCSQCFYHPNPEK